MEQIKLAIKFSRVGFKFCLLQDSCTFIVNKANLLGRPGRLSEITLSAWSCGGDVMDVPGGGVGGLYLG